MRLPLFFYEHGGVGAIATPRSIMCALRILGQLDAADMLNNDREKLHRQLESYYDNVRKVYTGLDNHSKDAFGAWRFHDGILYIRNSLEFLGFKSKPFPEGLKHLSSFSWAPQHNNELEAWFDNCCKQTNNRTGIKQLSQYLCLYRNLMRTDMDEHIRRIFKLFASKRDRDTGYIGVDDDIGWAMRGHRNNIMLFTLMAMGLREPLKWQVKVMETTLALQDKNGLFHDGSMCANMDAIHILAEYYLQTGLYGNEVLTAVRKAISGMLNILRHPDGGFYFDIQQKQDNQELNNNCWLMSGAGFFMESVRYWLAIDLEARTDSWKILDYSENKI